MNAYQISDGGASLRAMTKKELEEECAKLDIPTYGEMHALMFIPGWL